ncbi:MAG TPA: hypothetical protein VLF71_04550 [Candidatus Saccharimonadales bacterium]|nr:hypothetical protein [Candidatus Saccharimonadales bacterium]
MNTEFLSETCGGCLLREQLGACAPLLAERAFEAQVEVGVAAMQAATAADETFLLEAAGRLGPNEAAAFQEELDAYRATMAAHGLPASGAQGTSERLVDYAEHLLPEQCQTGPRRGIRVPGMNALVPLPFGRVQCASRAARAAAWELRRGQHMLGGH